MKGWRQIAFDRDGDCAAEIRTNGKFVLVNASGLGANSSGRYYLTNRDIKPIDWAISANADGTWARYYVPFVPGRDTGTVEITLATRQCSLGLAFEWDTYIPANDSASIRALGGETLPADDTSNMMWTAPFAAE
jgi:hypothetical protein